MKTTKRPKSSATTRPKPAKGKLPRRPNRRRPVVLVVDDEPVLRGMLKLALEQLAHFRVIDAATSELALELAEQDEVDVVISDLNRWPGMDGFQFLKFFKQTYPDTPVIVLSGVLTGARQRRAYRLGAFRCLVKPVSADEFLSVVREALEHRTARKNHAGAALSPS